MRETFIVAVTTGIVPCGRTIGTAAPFPWPGVRCTCGVTHVPDPDFHCDDHQKWESTCYRCQDVRILGWAVRCGVVKPAVRPAGFPEANVSPSSATVAKPEREPSEEAFCG